MNGSAFHASHMTGGPGSSLYTGTELDQSKVTIDYHWGAAIWNAADAAAARIRQDPDRIVRGESTPMPTTIYTIGYTGNNGCDDGLLKRVANDPRASGYVSTDKTGMYVEAANVAALEEAFNVIATAILRLASR